MLEGAHQIGPVDPRSRGGPRGVSGTRTGIPRVLGLSLVGPTTIHVPLRCFRSTNRLTASRRFNC